MLKVLGVCLALLSSAQAATLDGLSLPDTYPTAGQTLKLNGIGIRTLTLLRVKVYIAGLYVGQPSHDARAIMASPGPKVILLQFLHSASKSDIDKHYREGEERNCAKGGCNPADEADFEKLIAATPAAAVGDTLTYVMSGKGIRVLFNDKTIGDFNNPDLAQRLLAGFIGDIPPSEELKQKLLGNL